MRHLINGLVVAAMLAALVGCSVNPATGKKQLNMLDEPSEIALGAKSAPEFLKSYGGEIPSPEIRAYVSDLGGRLAAQGERPQLPWEFHVVDSSLINAFALPGGHVFVSRGLLVKLTNEAQLAAVIGHEIGHVTAQHSGQQQTRGMIVQGIGVVIAVLGERSDKDWAKYLGVGTTVGGTLYLLSYSRDHETQSDMLGLRYMTNLNYSPVGMVQLMKLFEAEAKGSGAGRVVWLSTHPLPKDRVANVGRIIREVYPDYDDPNKYHFNAEQYKAQVLDRLASLPPPKHDPKKQPEKQSEKQ